MAASRSLRPRREVRQAFFKNPDFPLVPSIDEILCPFQAAAARGAFARPTPPGSPAGRHTISQPQDTAGLQAQLDAALDRIRRLEEQLSAVEAIASDELQRNREAIEWLTAIVEGFIEFRASEGTANTVA